MQKKKRETERERERDCNTNNSAQQFSLSHHQQLGLRNTDKQAAPQEMRDRLRFKTFNGNYDN